MSSTKDINILRDGIISINTSFRLNEIDYYSTVYFDDNLDEIGVLKIYFINGWQVTLTSLDYSSSEIQPLITAIRDFFDNDFIDSKTQGVKFTACCSLPKDNIKMWTYGKKSIGSVGKGKKKEEIYVYFIRYYTHDSGWFIEDNFDDEEGLNIALNKLQEGFEHAKLPKPKPAKLTVIKGNKTKE